MKWTVCVPLLLIGFSGTAVADKAAEAYYRGLLENVGEQEMRIVYFPDAEVPRVAEVLTVTQWGKSVTLVEDRMGKIKTLPLPELTYGDRLGLGNLEYQNRRPPIEEAALPTNAPFASGVHIAVQNKVHSHRLDRPPITLRMTRVRLQWPRKPLVREPPQPSRLKHRAGPYWLIVSHMEHLQIPVLKPGQIRVSNQPLGIIAHIFVIDTKTGEEIVYPGTHAWKAGKKPKKDKLSAAQLADWKARVNPVTLNQVPDENTKIGMDGRSQMIEYVHTDGTYFRKIHWASDHPGFLKLVKDHKKFRHF